MLRSDALAPLSRDHQHALAAALRLRRADRAGARDAAEHFRAFFEDEGRAHFAIEEEHILPALPADDPEWAAGVARVHADHAAIREQAAALPGVADPDALAAAARTLGERLAEHVRFEERVLFVLLEQRLAPADLARVGEAVARAEARIGRGSGA